MESVRRVTLLRHWQRSVDNSAPLCRCRAERVKRCIFLHVSASLAPREDLRTMQPLVADVLLLPINLHDPLSMAESDALGKWLSAFEWTHWVSLSFRYPVTTDPALSVFRQWSSRLMRKPPAIATPTKSSCAVAPEPQLGGLLLHHVSAH